ncbi:PTS system, glucose-specific IIA component [Paenibacillus sophorae]|uniref:PTS glucose transporter subunit IIA n=1 Tax=Paenibacillus sophorae TaxID=1333845 RepID=A0A1H8VFV9_9BACL|nr:PTS glucose transporter subunit IIA [Paenibacillus sophorae]QWU16657.1 PTS glucose transporter subunit IIA [Paenibacillus sophorae]SEP13748.1 PTS system, glucose-specific IIA component [Paenibacillus sophorae]
MFGFAKKKKAARLIELEAPLKGKMLTLEEVPDPAFSSGTMGKGRAILPSEGKVTAPCPGTVVHIMEKSKHALLLEHETGIQMLIHVGIETVSLKGEGFHPCVSAGDKVSTGQTLLEFDLEVIANAGLSPITPIIIPDGQDLIESVEFTDDTASRASGPFICILLRNQ